MKLFLHKHPEYKLLIIVAILAVLTGGYNCYNHTDEKLAKYRKELDAKMKELDAKKEAK